VSLAYQGNDEYINSLFSCDIGASLRGIPMDRLHNSGKSSCETLFQSQCASWFWQSHTGEDSSLESVQRLVSQLFVLGENNIVRLGRMESIFIHAAWLWWLLPRALDAMQTGSVFLWIFSCWLVVFYSIAWRCSSSDQTFCGIVGRAVCVFQYLNHISWLSLTSVFLIHWHS